MEYGGTATQQEDLETLTLKDIRPGWGTFRMVDRFMKGKIQDRAERFDGFGGYLDVGAAISIILADVGVYRTIYEAGVIIANYIQNTP